MTGGSGNPGRPRSSRRLLGPSHKKPSGCPLFVLALLAVPTLASLAGWVAGAAFGWWS